MPSQSISKEAERILEVSSDTESLKHFTLHPALLHEFATSKVASLARYVTQEAEMQQGEN